VTRRLSVLWWTRYQLRSRKPAKRLRAVQTLSALKSPTAIAVLVGAALHDDDDGIRNEAAGALVTSLPEATAALLRALDDSRPVARARAADLLLRMNATAPDAAVAERLLAKARFSASEVADSTRDSWLLRAGQCLILLERWAEAEQAAVDVLEESPDDEEALKLWKRTRRAQGQPLTPDRSEDDRRRIYSLLHDAERSGILTPDFAARWHAAAQRGAIWEMGRLLATQAGTARADAVAEIQREYALSAWEVALIRHEGDAQCWASREQATHSAVSSPVTPLRDGLRCPHCQGRNRAPNWPRQGDYLPFYVQTAERTADAPGAYRLEVPCVQCSEHWFVVWDQDPR
jgi:hypothetical protein